MIDTPQIIQTTARLTAIIHFTIPREEMMNVFGSGVGELMTTLAAQGIAPAGPVFTHHLKITPNIFDFELSVPVSGPVIAAGRVKPSQWPAMKVARTVYHGPYEGLPASSWTGSKPKGTRQPRTFGSATSHTLIRTRTQPPGARNSTGH